MNAPTTRACWLSLSLATLLCVPLADAHLLAPLTPEQRRETAFDIRYDAALANRQVEPAPHRHNRDEWRFPNKIGNFSKTLPHDFNGEVAPDAYRGLLRAVKTGTFDDWERVPAGGTAKLANPMAGETYDLEGHDSHVYWVPAAPGLSSEETAGEAVELWWLALTRDINFDDYPTDPTIAHAAAELARLGTYKAPRDRENLFRGVFAGDHEGPYISQFLYQAVPYGPRHIEQKIRTFEPHQEYLTDFNDWLQVQNGEPAPREQAYAATPRFIRNGRDLAAYVKSDWSYQAYLDAALILLSWGPEVIDRGNIYLDSPRQGAFVDFGGPWIIDMIGRSAGAALRAAWFQKWNVHRRLRPEAYGGLADLKERGVKDYPIHPAFLNSEAARRTKQLFGSYLLPLAYTEGSPTHPAYPAGHAAIAGACVTILKAFFDENVSIPRPLMPSRDGLTLREYDGKLTIGGELNKLASNISLGRDAAGVHWRSDGLSGLLLGEQVALALLRDIKTTLPGQGVQLSLRKFDGTEIQI